jgi:manganese transport protein
MFPGIRFFGSFQLILLLQVSSLIDLLHAVPLAGSIYAGIFQEPFDISDNHSRIGIMITTVGALLFIFFIRDPFQGLIWSQIALSIQLPWTIFALIFLTSSSKVMGEFSNSKSNKLSLWSITAMVSF